MQLELRPEIFGPPESLPTILDLLVCVQEGRHIWAPDDVALASADTYLREHLPRLADAYLTLGRKGLVDLQWTSSIERPDVVVVDATSLADLASDLRRPAIVVVEDRDSDGSFIEALCQIFNASRVLHSLSLGWLEIRHSGGSGSLPSVAREEIERFHRKVRVAVLFDSDRLLPGQCTQAHAKAAELAKSGALVHVLEFREIENYLPNRVLAAVRPIRVSSYRLRFLKLLTLEQRAFYDMKHGFGPAGGDPQVMVEQAPLFGSLAVQTIRGLRGGFGRGVASKLPGMAPSLTSRDFEALGPAVVTEINEILVKIAQVL